MLIFRASGDVTLRKLFVFLYQVLCDGDNRDELNNLSLQEINRNKGMKGIADCFSSRLMYSVLH